MLAPLAFLDLLDTLESRQITLSVVGEEAIPGSVLNLKIQAPKGAVDAALQAAIKSHKPALIAQFRTLKPQVASAIQQRLWLLQQLEPESARYHESTYLALQGDVPPPEALVGALQHAQNRHLALRMGFERREGQIECTFNRPAVSTVSLDVSEDPVAFIRRPFDLAAGSLFRVCWYPDTQRLLLVFHHLIADAVSGALLWNDMLRFLQGDEAALLPCVHPELNAFQSTPQGAVQVATQATPQVTSPNTPFIDDMPRLKTTLTDTADSCVLSLPAAFKVQLEHQAKAHGVTAFSWFLSAWQQFIAGYWRLRTPFVATPLTERHRPQFADFQPVGSLINTFLATPLSPAQAANTSLIERVREQQNTLYAALEHGFDFTQALQSLDIPRHLPFFPSLGVVTQPILMASTVSDLPWGTLKVERLALPWLPAKFELLLSWFQGDAGVESAPNSDFLELAWPTGWYTASQMSTVLQHFLFFWEQTLNAPQQKLNQIPLLPIAARRALLERDLPQQNLSPSATPTHLLHERVAYFARHTPDAVALQYPGEVPLDYAHLNAAANQYARCLERSGVGLGDRVLVELPVGYSLMIALVAVLKAGAAYVPLVPDSPPLRRQLIIEAAQPVCILDAAWLAASESQRQVVDGKDGEDSEDEGEREDVDRGVTPEHCAYIIFTSGSTGVPKGVPITHRNITRLFPAVAQHMLFGSDEVWLLFHSIAFDFSVWEMWGAFYGGASLVLMPPGPMYRPEAVWDLILRYGVTQLSQTPSAFLSLAESLFERLSQTRDHQPIVIPLKQVILSGEKLHLPSLKRWWKQIGEAVQLVNAYGITETTVFVTWCVLTPVVRAAAEIAGQDSPIGRALPDLGLSLQDPHGEPVPEGVPGELCVVGAGVSPSFGPIYRSGDQAVWLQEQLYYLQRLDQQVQLRGHRVECREVEQALLDLPVIAQAHVFQWQDRLVAVVAHADDPAQETLWKQQLRQRLPEVMIPSRIVMRPHFPLTANGKQDTHALEHVVEALLLKAATSSTVHTAQAPSSSASMTWERLLPLFQRVLQREDIPLETSFFDLGAHSLLLLELQRAVEVELDLSLDPVLLFRYPTPGQLLAHLQSLQSPEAEPSSQSLPQPWSAPRELPENSPIAVIGMSLRFPGAESLAAYWELLKTGASGLHHWDTDTLLAEGEPTSLLQDPHYVPVSGWIPDTYAFDARYFGLSDADAQVLDPQQRLMLTLAHETLEHGGYAARGVAQHTGVFVSSGLSRYLLETLLPRFQQGESHDTPMQLLVANDKDYLPTRIAYHLNLTGPALSIQSACSSSLAALHLACASLRRGECNQALAGGVNLDTRPRGYLYQEGGIYAASGICAPFDASATGIVGGSGGGWVLLKPLAQAQADGDTVYGVIEGSMLNNDGADKVGYFAPGVQGQAQVVTQALQSAGCKPTDIGYIEAHGTGTRLGDPIEVAALKQVWSTATTATIPTNQKTVIGSVKGNIGHLDAAAGIASVIKVMLMLHYRQRVPTVHFKSPNPALDLAHSPFEIAQSTEPWEDRLRAGISALGVGGTNGHVICAAAPALEHQNTSQGHEPALLPVLLPFSLPHPRLLPHWITRLREALTNADSSCLQHWARALGERKTYAYRFPVVATSTTDLLQQLAAFSTSAQTPASSSMPEVVFLCPGLGSQSAAHLMQYLRYPVFATHFHQCCTLLASWADPETISCFESLQSLDPVSEDSLVSFELALCHPQAMQLSIFITGWCLAQLWKSVGITPQRIVGHSFGECLAMALAGWVSLEDALRWVALRGTAFALLPAENGVLAVAADPKDLPLNDWPDLFLATHNAQDRCAITGPREILARFATRLAESRVVTRLLDIPHGVHYPALASAELSEALRLSTAHFQATPPPLTALPAALPAGGNTAPPLVWSCVLQDWHQSAPDSAYWQLQAIDPLDFRPAVSALSVVSHTTTGSDTVLIELSGHPHLSGLFQGPQFHQSLQKSRADFLHQWAAVWCAGLSLTAIQSYPKQVSTVRLPALPPTPLNAQEYRLRPPLPLLHSNAPKALEPAIPLQIKTWQPVSSLRLQAESAHSQLSPDQVLLCDTQGPLPTPAQLKNVQALVIRVPDSSDYATSLSYLEQCRQFVMALALRPWQGLLIWQMPAFSALPMKGLRFPSYFPLQPLQALLQAFLQVLPATYPRLRVYLQECYTPSDVLPFSSLPLPPLGLADIAFQHRVWVPSGDLWQVWMPACTEPPEAELLAALPSVLRQGGVYAITGATGGVATVLARYLQLHYDARLLLLSRQPEAIDPDVLSGGEVLARWVDLCDVNSVHQALQSALHHWGVLDGVLHTAGGSDSRSLAESTPSFLRQALAPKVEGLMSLSQALQDLASQGHRPPDFVALCSAPEWGSAATAVNAVHQWAYQAGNRLCDAWCDACNAPDSAPTRWVSLRWGHWKETGMAYRLKSHLPLSLQQGYARYLAQGIENAEAGPLWEQSLKLMSSCVELKVLPQSSVQALWAAAFEIEADLNDASDAIATTEVTATTETTIAALWTRYLGRAPQATDRFSDLGGDSLAALQLKSALENELHLSVPLPLLLQDLPFAEFEQALQTSKTSAQITQKELPLGVLVPLNQSASKGASASSEQSSTPLFFVHAISGTVFPFQHLAQALQRPLVGVQSVGLLSASDPHSQALPTEIEEIAALYCAVIETQYPPPYTVGGWSFGALVAFSMARHWHQRGIAVAELILLDMEPPDTQQWTPDILKAHFEADLARVWPESQSSDSAGVSSQVSSELSKAQQQFKQRLEHIFEAHAQATRSFSASLLPVPARLLIAEAGLTQDTSPSDSHWHAVLPQLQTHRVPGDHYTCLAPEAVKQWAPYVEDSVNEFLEDPEC